MSSQNDTTPDAAPKVKDTDPGFTDPNFTGAKATPRAKTVDSVPGADTLLDGFELRPPLEAETSAESAGSDAAEYAGVAVPPKAYEPRQLPAVVIATTEPLPRGPVMTKPVQHRAQQGREGRSPKPNGAAREQETTVPGLQRVRFTRRNLTLSIVTIIVAGFLTSLVLVFVLSGSQAAVKEPNRKEERGVSAPPPPSASTISPPVSTSNAPTEVPALRASSTVHEAAPQTTKPAVTLSPARSAHAAPGVRPETSTRPASTSSAQPPSVPSSRPVERAPKEDTSRIYL